MQENKHRNTMNNKKKASSNGLPDRPLKKHKKNHEKDESDDENNKEEVYIPTGPRGAFFERNVISKIKHKKQKEFIEETERQTEKVEILLPAETGYIETEGMEKTFKLTQNKIAANVDIRAAKKIFDLKLDKFGPYSIDYTRNGRYLLLAGAKGHLSMLDWDKKHLVKEFQVQDRVRDIKFLHNETMFAVAQKRNVYIYDRNGVELHCLPGQQDVNRLEFLPYHFLLVAASEKGFIHYQDVSTGQYIGCCRAEGIGHSDGFSSMLVPGAGIANYDSLEADPYSSKFNRAEAEVKNLLEKIPADMITLEPDKLGEVVQKPEGKKKLPHPGLINVRHKHAPVSAEQLRIVEREKLREQNEVKIKKEQEQKKEYEEANRTGTILDRFINRGLEIKQKPDRPRFNNDRKRGGGKGGKRGGNNSGKRGGKNFQKNR